MSLSALFRHTVDWERPYITMDGAQGSQREFQKFMTGLRCLIQPVTARDRLLFAQRSIAVTHHLYFDRLLDLRTGDRFFMGQRVEVSPVVYLATAWFDQGGQDGRCFCVEAREIKL